MVVAAGSVLASAPVQAQEVTVLRGSPPRPSPPYPSIYDNSQDNQSGNYSPSGYDDSYPYYGDGFPLGVGDGRGFRGGFHRGNLFHRGFHRGGFHAGFHGGGFHGG